MGNSHSKTQLKTAVAQRRWSDAFSLLADSSYSNSAVEHFIKYCDKYGLDSEFSLSDINTEERDALLKTAVRVRQWNVVHHVLKAGVSHGMRVWVLEQACKKDFQEYIMQYVDDFLTLCSTEQLGTLLTTATSNGQWNFVNKLCSGGSHSERIQIIEHACKTADECYLQVFIQKYVDDGFLSQCSTDQLNALLTTATTQRMWYMVYQVLKADVSHERRVWVIKQACRTANFSQVSFFLLPQVTDDFLSQCGTKQLDTLLTTATTRGLWHVVHKVLKVVDSHEKRVWVIEQACETANDWDLEEYIQPHVDEYFLSLCSTEQLDNLLTSQVKSSQVVTQTNGRWYVVNMLLRAGGSLSQRKHIIEHVCKTDDFWDFQHFMLHYVDSDFLSLCSTELLETLLSTATTRGLWYLVDILLEVVDSHEKRVWVIEQACKRVNSSQFLLFILPHLNDVFLSQCSTMQLVTLMTTAATHGVWLLKADVSHEKRVWVLEQACKTASHKDFIKEHTLQYYVDDDFLTHCSTEQLDTLLITATTNRRWDFVKMLLCAGGSHSQRIQIIEHACKTADYEDFQNFILEYVDDDVLSHCSTEQLNTLLTTATTQQHVCAMVRKMLKLGFSHENRVWVIDQACTMAEYSHFNYYILSYVDNDFISHCNSHQLDTLLTTATAQGLWSVVCKVLKVVDIHEKRVWVIKQACEIADYDDFDHYILPYVDNDFLSSCNTQQLDTLLTTATKRGLWHMVCKLLETVDSHEKRVLVINEACTTESYIAFEYYILSYVDEDFLSHCSTEQLDTLLTTAVTRGLWQMVHKVLKTGINHEKHVWVIEQACKTASYKDIEKYILPHLDDFFLSSAQRDRLLHTSLTRGLWHMVHKLLKIVNNHENRVWVIQQACKTANFSQVEMFILPQVHDDFLSRCTTEQLDTFLTTATTRGLWHMVHTVLKAGCSHEKRVWVIKQACKTANNDYKDYILPYVDHDFLSQCSKEQLDTLLTAAGTQPLWHIVHKVLQTGVNHEKHVWVMKQTCISGNYNTHEYMLPHIDDDLLSHCSTEQLGTLLTTTTTKGKWYVVNMLLHAAVSHSQRIQIIEHACKTANFRNFQYFILEFVDSDFLSHCSTQQLDTLLTTATTRGLWSLVNKMLEVVDNHEKRVWVIEQACKTANFPQVLFFILPHVQHGFLAQCSTEQLDTLLTTATTQGLWHMVNKVLKVVDIHEKRIWVIDQACKTATYSDFEEHILQYVNEDFLSHCSPEQLDSWLTTATTRGFWHMVHKVLKSSVSHEKRVWVIDQACRTADYKNFEDYILPQVDSHFLPQCSTEQLDILLTAATTNGQWDFVRRLLCAGGSHGQRIQIIEHTCNSADFLNFQKFILEYVDDDFLSHCRTEQLDTLLTTATTRSLWHVVHKVLEVVDHNQHKWVTAEAVKTANDWDFTKYILPHCSDDQLEPVLTHLVTRGLWQSVGKVLEKGVSDSQQRRAVEEASKAAGDVDFMFNILPPSTNDQLESVLIHLVSRGLWRSVGNVLERGLSVKSRTWALSEACKRCSYTTVMRWIERQMKESNVQLLIRCLPSNQLSREAQSVALRFALQRRRWDVISRASMSQVWEEVRRHLFREAVYQKQWTIVKKWADHRLYDDERWWALEEAYKDKQWDVMLRLADHGLTEIELMRVRYRLAKHADWEVVLRMFERGVDVTEVREMVETVMLSRKAKADKEKHCALVDRWWQLRQLEEKLIHASATRISLPSTASQWQSVLFHLHRHPGTVSVRSRSQPSKTFGGLLLQRAIKQRAWHLVMHLVTLGMATSQLDLLLTDMIRRRQWGVCRVLLEQGVSVQSCLHSLFVFMEMNQWMLVARVIEFIVDDSLKHQVEQLALDRSVGSLVWQCVSAMCRYGMSVGDTLRLHVIQRAMEKREGSVVGECINTMEHYRLSAKEREELFQKAISRGILQAVKPLVEKKDETEFHYRDNALLAAIEQRQWDVVDCCQLQGADIDKKDEHGETPLLREVRNVEWKAVEELVVRGADPNVLDKDGCSVLNKAIHAEQWDIVRLLIEYLGDIHKAARYETKKFYEAQAEILTPLQGLINARQGGIIHHTLMWCPDQAKGVNDQGETTLHAIALDKRPELLYYNVVRGVNPLTLTKGGQSVLLYAVQNDHCPQKMVAECIRLGFGTHQPRPTYQTTVDVAVVDSLLNMSYVYITSPFLLAMVREMPVVAHMLYESGSCTYTELLHLHGVLEGLSCLDTDFGRTLPIQDFLPSWDSRVDFVWNERFNKTVAPFLPCLKEMATTPRSLVSTCRLVISHSITVRKRHERDVQDLFMTDRMKKYLLFSDLTDPDYQPSMYGRCHHTELRNRKELELEQWMKKTYDKTLKDLEGTDSSEVHLSARNASTQRDSV